MAIPARQATPVTQAKRFLELTTPFGADTLVINSISGSESLSRLYEYRIEAMGAPGEIEKIQDLLGKSVHVGAREGFGGGFTHHYHGIVSRISAGERDLRFQHYEIQVVPWLWLLTRHTDCRIFQGKTVVEIIKEIFDSYPSKLYRETLAKVATYPKIDYCVQYRETDFNFVSRLMEDYGITYFFEHTENSHTLVLADALTAYKAVPVHKTIPFYEGPHATGEPVITEWHGRHQLNSTKYTLRDYHLELTNKDLQVVEGSGDYELYDFPGGYAEIFNAADNNSKVTSHGSEIVRIRLEEEELSNYICEGSSECFNMRPGYKFTLSKHSNADGEYIITSVTHRARQTPDYIANELLGNAYTNTFTCVKNNTKIRPQRITPKPVVSGPQTATVTVKQGEESWLDKYGRVRIQFHWDRTGTKDEKSTCWVRVAQAWSANLWGAHFWPRVGHEVVVDFLEGDPDQPIITGSVYNAQNMPPYALPGNYTRSGIKTRSSKEGGTDNYNELRFEDKKGSEQIYFQAEKDIDHRVKNDSREYIGNNRHLIVQGNHSEKIEKNRSTEITGDLKQKVTGNVSLNITGEHKEKVAQKKSLHAMDIHGKADMSYAMDAGMTVHIKAGMAAVIEAGTQLTLKVGGNFIDINPAGVSIQGTMVLINSGGAAGVGSGSSPAAPDAPDAPDEADDGSKGTKKN